MAFQAKRKFKRSVQKDGVRVTSKAGIEYAIYDDISAGGVRLIMDYGKDQNSTIEMEFSVRGESGENLGDIRAHGRVVHSIKSPRGYEVGVAFVNLDDRIRAMLERLIDAEEGPF